ncbi:hypothetical protein FB565_007991 [Actinoplanes lutulentus]|uniref:hypothetical protein n=1 Tax=Actinoplanes lutulentus TaxID=1287878 RepID=UPI0015EB5245|nr:hypothetical protein [Actinoplanes lutulentus]MBB2948208.1 hypothetical protein [Actinoplanes lutulentus]
MDEPEERLLGLGRRSLFVAGAVAGLLTLTGCPGGGDGDDDDDDDDGGDDD